MSNGRSKDRVTSIIKAWLASSHKKIESFWVGAEWDKWARYELFMALERDLGSACLVTHGNDDIFFGNGSGPINGREEMDVLIEPREDPEENNPVAIKLVCERVSENEGSYEGFRGKWDETEARLDDLGDIQDALDGVEMLLLGFSGQPSVDGPRWRQTPPEHFCEGEVHAWLSWREQPLDC